MKNNMTIVVAGALGLALSSGAFAAHPSGSDDAMDRVHASVAAARDIEQQRWIIAGLRSGRLSVEQASRLERDQAALLTRQARLDRRGHESVEQALHQSHRQDVQDWAIRTAHVAG
jgi:hypothetical protein